MEFEVEFYEREDGSSPVEEFLEELEAKLPALYDLTMIGLRKLMDSRRHGSRLTKHIGDRIYELRVGGRNIVRILWFYAAGAKIVLLHGFVKKSERTPPNELRKALDRRADYLRRC
jgi:phage-related protein